MPESLPKQSGGREGTTFRQAFCRHFHCAPESFERRLLTRCLPPLARVLVVFWLAAKPASFAREIALLSRLGAARDPAILRPELDGYAYENERDKPFRVEVLGLRLSRRRCLRIFRQVMAMEGKE